jgi:hypothetical protein
VKPIAFILGFVFGAMLVGCVQTERGFPGEPGAPGVAGPAGRDGVDGANGRDGADGSNGQDGADGTDGRDGLDGINGTLVSVVNLCPGETVYPSVFVEVAFCISGKLYATYSSHGGFSTEIPPGRYTSNTVGSRCDFTVLANCEVTP